MLAKLYLRVAATGKRLDGPTLFAARSNTQVGTPSPFRERNTTVQLIRGSICNSYYSKKLYLLTQDEPNAMRLQYGTLRDIGTLGFQLFDPGHWEILLSFKEKASYLGHIGLLYPVHMMWSAG